MNPELSPPPVPTQDERVMAALSHVSALLPLMGALAPIVIWVTQKDKSRFVGFQSLQAIALQLLMIASYFVGFGCYLCSFLIIFIPLMWGESQSRAAAEPPVFAFAVPFAAMGLMLASQAAFIIYGLVGAIQTLRGRDFRYFLLGARVERYMQGK